MDKKYTDIIIIKDNILKQREFTTLNKAFRTMNIPMAPIKGMALLYELKSYAETRPMADIDILVRKEDIDKSIDILSGLGYKIQTEPFSQDYYFNDYHHLPFHNKYMVELHWALSLPRPNNIILPELWKRARQIKYEEDVITILSPEDTIFSLTLHLRRFNNPFLLRYIQDICEILKIHGETLDWQYILKYSRLNNLRSLLYYALISVKINFGYPLSCKIINMFYPGILRAFLLKFFINMAKHNGVTKLMESASFRKCAYILLRLLLYGHLWDFIKFIALMPEEEFSRFYSIRFPSKISSAIYSLRFLAMPFLALK